MACVAGVRLFAFERCVDAMLLLSASLLGCFAIYYRTVIRRSGRLTANSIFVYLSTVMAVGSVVLLDTAYRADVVYGWIIAYTLIVYMLASAVLTFSQPPPPAPSERKPVVVRAPTAQFWGMAWLAGVVVILYFREVGYSAFLLGLQAQLGGDPADISTLRLESYSGSRYLFPGYVNQFKNVLQPALLVLAITYWTKSGMLSRRWFLIAMWGAFTLFGLLGTGQRGAFVISAAVTLTYLYLMNNERFSRRTALVLAAVGVLLILSTVALGRSTGDLSSTATISERVGVATPEVAERVFTSNQGSAVIGFRYIYSYTQVENGREWAQSLAGAIPGVSGSDLVNRIFAYRYGSMRGSSPPSIWGSVYHNFGWVGIAASPALLAALLVGISRRGTRSPRRDAMEVMGIAGVFTVCGFWVAGGPLFLLNNGILVYSALWAIGARARRRNERLDGHAHVPATTKSGAPARARRGGPGPGLAEDTRQQCADAHTRGAMRVQP